MNSDYGSRLGATNSEDRQSFGLAFQQRAFWFDEQFRPRTVQNHVSVAVRVLSPGDSSLLRRAIQRVVDANPSMRTIFDDVDGTPRQTVVDEMRADYRFVDASEWSEEQLDTALRADHVRPFDLESGPPARFVAYRRRADEHIVVIVIHHVVADIWSQTLLAHQIADAYRSAAAESSGSPEHRENEADPTAWTYRDFVEHEATIIASEKAAAASEHWRPIFEVWAPQTVPADRPPNPASLHLGGVQGVKFEHVTSGDLRGAAEDRSVSVRTLVLAAFHALLARTTGARFTMIAEAKANRSTRTAQVIGCCMNQVPRAGRFDGHTTLDDVVIDIERQSRESKRHESVPFGWLLNDLRPGHGTEPFFEAGFAWQKTSRRIEKRLVAALALGDIDDSTDVEGASEFAGYRLEPIKMPVRSSPLPLTLLAAQRDDEIHLSFEYQLDRFDPASVELLAHRLELVLRTIIEAPQTKVDNLNLITTGEHRRAASDWQRAQHRFDDSIGTQRLVERTVAAIPSSTALIVGRSTLSYADLDTEANKLAHRLIESSVRSGDLVGICLERSADMLVSMLAVWKAGAGYVPMDPDFPPDRLAAMVVDARVERVITKTYIWDGIVERASSSDALERVVRIDPAETAGAAAWVPSVDVGGADVAYVIFTSGSTGRPKGVVVEHRSVVNFVEAMRRRPGMGPDDVVLAATTLSFDISVLELILPLTVGAAIDLVDRDTARDPALLADALERVTVAQGTPTMWKMLVDDGWRGSDRLTVLCGGEPLPRPLADALLDRSRELWNMYGPTETTVWSAVEEMDGQTDRVSIGRPIDNTRLVVLDPENRRCPDGIVGELWIGGAGVARGYINRPDLTAERFVVDPAGEGHGVMYRTGDLVRRNADGDIAFVGRVDQQVKLRGHRIELEEIEAVIAQQDLVIDAIASVRDFGDDDQRLVVYYRVGPGSDGTQPDSDAMASLLRSVAVDQLPGYMVPSAFVRVDEFPRTPNNKVDRNRLPDPRPDSQRQAERPTPTAQSATIEAVVDVFRSVFDDPSITANDDFFALGGHSLLATRIVSRLRLRFGREIPLRAVFEHADPVSLASIIEAAPRSQIGHDGSTSARRLAPELGSLRSPELDSTDGRLFDLSSSQQRMWFLQTMHPTNTAYNLVGLVRIRGDIDADTMQRSLDRVVQRHTSLRSVIVERDGWPAVRVLDPFPVDLRIVDRRGEFEPDTLRDKAVEAVRREADQPCDLARLPLFRVVAHRITDTESMIGFVFHHVIADQWSFGVFAYELALLVRAERSGVVANLEPAPRAELYSQWQHEHLTGDVLDGLLGYWRRTLDGVTTIDLQTDRPRKIETSMAGRSVSAKLPEPLVAAVRAMARDRRVSEFMVEFAAFQLLLHRMSGANDIAVGVPIANRHWLESESLITTLVNTLVLRSDLTSTPFFEDLLEQVRNSTLDAYAHQDLPFELLVEAIAPERDPGRSPLFQILFNAQNAPFEIPEVDGVDVDIVPVERHAAQFDLSVTIDSTVTDTVTVEYSSDLFDHQRMVKFLDDYLAVLNEVTAPGGGETAISRALLPRTSVDVADTSSTSPISTPASTRVAASHHEPPHPGLERHIADIWEAALGVADISRNDDFFDLGGHSILAVRIFSRIAEVTEHRPPLSLLFHSSTVATLSASLRSDGWMTPWTSLVPVRPGDAMHTPFFYVSPFLITALSFHELASRIDSPRPFYVFQPQGLEGDDPIHQRVEDMAAHYIREMKTVQPVGPYLLGGHCAGGWVAFEMARQLQQRGDVVRRLIVVDVEPPGVTPPSRKWLQYIASRFIVYAGSGRLAHALAWRLSMWWQRFRVRHLATEPLQRADHLRHLHQQAHERYEGGTVSGDLTFVRSQEWTVLPDKRWHTEWAQLIDGDLEIEVIPGAHARLLDGDAVVDLAHTIDRVLAKG